MQDLIRRYGNRNRIQVWFALIVFTCCSWWALHPLQFHLLDGMNLVVVMLAGALATIGFPFNSASDSPELLLILLNTAAPFLLYAYFKHVGARYMTATTFFWFSYAAQKWFRLFHNMIYRLPALAMFILSLLLLIVGLLKCLHNSESDVIEDFKTGIEKAEASFIENNS